MQLAYIVPAKDPDAGFLKAMLLSIQDSSDRGVSSEVLVIDDGSADLVPSGLPCAVRLRVIRNRGVPGVAGALNYGISQTDADVILRLDSDDLAMNGRMSLTSNAFMEDSGLGVLVGGFSYIDASGRKLATSRVPWKTRNDLSRLLALTNPIIHPATAFRRDLLGEFPYSNDKAFEDYDLWMRLVIAGVSFRYVPDVVTRYRLTPSSASRQGRDYRHEQLVVGHGEFLRVFGFPTDLLSLVTEHRSASSEEMVESLASTLRWVSHSDWSSDSTRRSAMRIVAAGALRLYTRLGDNSVLKCLAMPNSGAQAATVQLLLTKAMRQGQRSWREIVA